MCDFMKKNKQKKQKKETWNLIVMGSQSELYNMPLSKKSRSLKEKKKKEKIHRHTNIKLHGQFSYKPNEKVVTRPSYSTGLSKTYNMISSFCVCFTLWHPLKLRPQLAGMYASITFLIYG